jgi:hypothetical protein
MDGRDGCDDRAGERARVAKPLQNMFKVGPCSAPLPSLKKKEKRVVLRVCFPHFPLFWISAMNEWIFFLPSFQLVTEGLIVLFFFLRNYVSRFGWDWVTRSYTTAVSVDRKARYGGKIPAGD